MRREWKTEWMKVRHRKIGLLLLAFLALSFVWILWAMQQMPEEEAWDGYRKIFMQLPLVDTILLPTMIAMLASRLCDAEVKGDTFKMLCTMEKKGRLFDMKLLMGAVYLAFFTAAQIGMIFLFGKLCQFGRPLEPKHLLYFILQIYMVSFAVFLLQQVLSFHFENQIIPLAAGLFGSFAGLFCWYLGGMARKFLLWGLYAELCFINFDWDRETRIVTYYDKPFNTASLCLLLLFIAAGYGAGKLLFLKKEA